MHSVSALRHAAPRITLSISSKITLSRQTSSVFGQQNATDAAASTEGVYKESNGVGSTLVTGYNKVVHEDRQTLSTFWTPTGGIEESKDTGGNESKSPFIEFSLTSA